MCHVDLHELWTPLLGRSCRANRHWGANVLWCGDWDRLDGNFQAQTITNRNKIIQPWKVGWPSVEKVLDPQTEIGGICWMFLSTENGWFSSPTLWMQKIDLDISRHCWVSNRCHLAARTLLGRSCRGNRPWGVNVLGVEIGTDWTGNISINFLGGGNVVPRLSDSADGVDNRPRW